MSIEDLEEQNILLPEEEWGQHELKTTASQIPMLILFACSITGCVLSFLGNGNLWTWVGIVLFFVSFFGIVLLCDRAIVKQRERTNKEKTNLSANGKKDNGSSDHSE